MYAIYGVRALPHLLTSSHAVSEVVASRYAAVQDEKTNQKALLENKLDDFRAHIPEVLQYRGIDPVSGQGYWAAMLLMAFKYVKVPPVASNAQPLLPQD